MNPRNQRTNAGAGAAVSIKMNEIKMPADVIVKSENGFNFKGTDSLEKKVESFIMVATVEQAMFELENAGIVVESIRARKGSGRKKNKAPSRIELATFAESFGEQMEINGSAADICELIASDATNGTLINALRKGSATMIRSGSPVYIAFAEQLDKKGQPVFPVDLVYNAKMAEETGASPNPETDESEGAWFALMRRFAEGMKEADSIANQVKSASYYPIGVFAFCIVAVLFVLYTVMPRFKDMYSALLTGKDDRLPFLTQMLIDLSDFLLSWMGLLSMIGIGIAVTFAYRWFKSPAGQLWWQENQLKVPVFGAFYKDMNAAKSLRTASMLASGERDIKRRFAITAETCPNIVYKRAYEHISFRLKEGVSLTSVCTPYASLFGSDFRGITRSIDEAGDMQGQFYRYAKILESRAKRKLERLLFVFSTFAILPVGILIAIVVIALYSPLFQLVGRMSSPK